MQVLSDAFIHCLQTPARNPDTSLTNAAFTIRYMETKVTSRLIAYDIVRTGWIASR